MYHRKGRIMRDGQYSGLVIIDDRQGLLMIHAYARNFAARLAGKSWEIEDTGVSNLESQKCLKPPIDQHGFLPKFPNHPAATRNSSW